jgi:hypothetical protein
MDSLYSIQRSLLSTYNYLPIISIIVFLTLGLGLGNYGMISISITQLVLCVITFILRIGYRRIFQQNTNSDNTVFALFPAEAAPQHPSIWLINVSFLFSAIIYSAWSVYKIEPSAGQINDDKTDSKIGNRKTRCLMIITFCSILALLFIGYRIFVVESSGKIMSLNFFLSLAATGAGIGAAALWNTIMEQPTVGLRNMDIFGISQQLVAVNKADLKTMCELQSASPGQVGDSCYYDTDCVSSSCNQTTRRCN